MDFNNGVVNNPIKEIGKSQINKDNKFLTGTKITFLPSTKIFSNIEFNALVICLLQNLYRSLPFFVLSFNPISKR